MNDLDLLRQYEPILRFTKGELFFPCDVVPYVERCSLWSRQDNEPPTLIVPAGELTVGKLGQYKTAHSGQSLYLRFVQEPLRGLAFNRWMRRKDRPRFRAPGRLARVGLVARLVDSGFDLGLLLRGKVPGGTVAAAEVAYRKIYTRNPIYPYYGRVVRDNGYIVLHYLYFYAMNNWRTTYYGINDHEADWEQVFVYLAEQEGRDPIPTWVAYASHDFHGDDLRRRWDDPELHREGTHPVVYVGAGSHASYFSQGEYLTRIEIGFLHPLVEALWRIQEVWYERLGQGVPSERARDRISNLLSLPFVDYARGDGLSIGPGQACEWNAVLMSGEMTWVENYRGLWGLDTRDPFKGENAPAGPKYQRDGTIRESWHNPLGWSGLHKVPTPQQLKHTLQERVDDVQSELADVRAEIARLRQVLPQLNLEVLALQRMDHLSTVQKAQRQHLLVIEQELNALFRRESVLEDTLLATQEFLHELESGQRGDPQAHIANKHQPQSPDEIEENTLLENWAALSAGLLLLGFAGLMLYDPSNWFIGLASLIGLYAIIETTLRRRLAEFLLSISLVLALITSTVLIYEFFWELVGLGVVGIAVLILVINWRELRGI